MAAPSPGDASAQPPCRHRALTSAVPTVRVSDRHLCVTRNTPHAPPTPPVSPVPCPAWPDPLCPGCSGRCCARCCSPPVPRRRPYDGGDGRGKDRPVLVVGRRGADLVGLMLSSKDHDRDAADEARYGRTWMDVGRGGWDPRGRPSEVRLDRLLLLPPGPPRREGAAIGRAVFDDVVAALRALHR